MDTNYGLTYKVQRVRLEKKAIDVAKEAKLIPSSYSRIENRVSKPTHHIHEAICRVLALDPETLEPLKEPLRSSVCVVFPDGSESKATAELEHGKNLTAIKQKLPDFDFTRKTLATIIFRLLTGLDKSQPNGVPVPEVYVKKNADGLWETDTTKTLTDWEDTRSSKEFIEFQRAKGTPGESDAWNRLVAAGEDDSVGVKK